jgi:hypothetical protein
MLDRRGGPVNRSPGRRGHGRIRARADASSLVEYPEKIAAGAERRLPVPAQRYK